MRWQKWRLKSTDNRKFSTETEASFFTFVGRLLTAGLATSRKLASADFGLQSTACKKNKDRNGTIFI